jgi:hypothetical protein
MKGAALLKQIFIGVSLVGIGFLSGTYYVGKEVDEAMAIGIAAQLVRQDQVLSYLEANNADAAKQLQAKYLKSTLNELKTMDVNWPQEIQVVVNRRGDATLKK